MAKKIKWSPGAAADRIQVLDYWFERTGNKRYSKKLDKGFREVVTMLSRLPEIGRKVENREERYFVKGNYLIF
jgi:plasmid stabilization system protein ParE